MKIVVYTKSYCGYCVRAKSLLEQLGFEFELINLDDKPDEMAALVKQHGMRTLPQIFFDGKLIGGYQELAEMERSRELRKLLP